MCAQHMKFKKVLTLCGRRASDLRPQSNTIKEKKQKGRIKGRTGGRAFGENRPPPLFSSGGVSRS